MSTTVGTKKMDQDKRETIDLSRVPLDVLHTLHESLMAQRSPWFVNVDKGKAYLVRRDHTGPRLLISRNRPCPLCGSGRKFKDCCADKFGLVKRLDNKRRGRHK